MPKSVGRAGVTSSRRTAITELSDPDNGILFLDNEDRWLNPRNEKTPPPPMWGEVLEEDLYDDSQPFYDHEKALVDGKVRNLKLKSLNEKLPPISQDGRKLRRKVIYVYEKDDPKDEVPKSKS